MTRTSQENCITLRVCEKRDFVLLKLRFAWLRRPSSSCQDVFNAFAFGLGKRGGEERRGEERVARTLVDAVAPHNSLQRSKYSTPRCQSDIQKSVYEKLTKNRWVWPHSFSLLASKTTVGPCVVLALISKQVYACMASAAKEMSVVVSNRVLGSDIWKTWVIFWISKINFMET